MGEEIVLNSEQKIILEEVNKTDYLLDNFYFTGGTALSEVYLKHRESVDLDFFSENEYDPQALFNFVSGWSKKYNFIFESQYIDPTHIYLLDFGKEKLKLDFAYYPYSRLRKGQQYQKIEVDSKLDIAVNKLLLVNSQRIEVKDYVDLYFLFKEFNVWELMDGVKQKFNNKIEPYILASDFMVVEDFEFLPRMYKELTLEELKEFFVEEAKRLGKKSTVNGI